MVDTGAPPSMYLQDVINVHYIMLAEFTSYNVRRGWVINHLKLANLKDMIGWMIRSTYIPYTLTA